MQWDSEAEEALARVPGLLRRFVRGKVEGFARARGLERVTKEAVEGARRALAPGRGEAAPDPALVERLERDLLATEQNRRVTRTYEVRVCAGAVGCPRTLLPVAEAADALVETIEASGFPAWLEAARAGRPLLSHHRFKAAVAGCPNACSQPQICAFGVIGRAEISTQADRCTACGQCLLACHEAALSLDTGPHLAAHCLGCGDCARVCPTGALEIGRARARVLTGGKLGRHPRLAEEVEPAAAMEEVGAVLRQVLAERMGTSSPTLRL